MAIVASAIGMLGIAVAWTAVPSAADTEPPPPIHVELLTPRSEFTDKVSGQIRLKLDRTRTNVLNMGDMSRVVTAKITVQPGAHFPWHTHPGPVIANVVEGELIYVYARDCVDRRYPAGTLFVDPGHGNVHTAYNPADEVTVIYATFFEVPAEGPLTIPADAPENCQIQVGSHAH